MPESVRQDEDLDLRFQSLQCKSRSQVEIVTYKSESEKNDTVQLSDSYGYNELDSVVIQGVLCKDERLTDYDECDEVESAKKSGSGIRTGRKVGYKMPNWSKALLASRRDSIALESINKVLSKIGEELMKFQSSDDAFFLVTSSSGKQKTLLLIGGNTRNLPNTRNFLFRDIDIGSNVNFRTQEIYSGIISGLFMPLSPKIRSSLYEILAESPEVQTSIKEKVLTNKNASEIIAREIQKIQNCEEDSGCLSIPEDACISRNVLTEIRKIVRAKKKRADRSVS